MAQIILIITLLFSITSSFATIDKIDVSKIKRVSLVYADTAEGLESSFGHIGVRLSVGDEYSIHDLSAEFVADTSSSSSGIEMYIRGAGVYNPFPVIVQFDYFENYKKLKSINENRKLEIVELDLSPNELQAFLKFIDDFQNGKIDKKYYFLTANCSEIPIKALEVATNNKIDWSNVPYKVIEVIKKMKMAKVTNSVKNASALRFDILDQYILSQDIQKQFPDETWNENFVSNIMSPIYSERQTSYIKILWLLQNDYISSSTYRKFFIKMKRLEDGFDKYLFKKVFDPRKAKHKRLFAVQIGTNQGLVKSSVKVKVDVLNKQPVINLDYAYKKDKTKRLKDTKTIRLSTLSYDQQTKQILYKGKMIGSTFKTEENDFVFLDSMVTFTEVFRSIKSSQVNAYILIDTETYDLSPNEKNISKKQDIALLNGKKFGVGACYSLAKIQKALFQRAIFSNAKKNSLTSDELLELVKKAVNGQYVIFQGFSDIDQLTNAINQKDLINYINAYQKQINSNAVSTLWTNITEREEVTPKNIEAIKALTDRGYSVTTFLGYVDVSGSKPKLIGNIGHVINIYKLTQFAPNRYNVFTYDPNIGTDELYILEPNKYGKMVLKQNKKSQIFRMKGNYEMWPMLDVLDENDINLNTFVIGNGINQRKVDKLDSMAIPFRDLFSVLN